MAGLLDFLGLQSGGGGLLGLGMPQQQTPQNILPPGMAPNLAGNTHPYPGGVDPTIYALRALQNPPQASMFDSPMLSFGLGLAGGNTAGEGLQGAARAAQLYQAQRSQQSQEALKNYIALKGLGIQEKAAEEKPQYQTIEDPQTGIKRLVQIQPYGKGVNYINPNEPSAAAGTAQPQPPLNIPPGADVHEYRKKLGADAAANQQEAISSAKVAADLLPQIKEASAAYEEAHKLGAIGPVAGSTPGRYVATGMAALGDATGLGSTSKEGEAARQRYDRAQAALQAKATQVANAGQGAVSNYERQLFARPIPNLTALVPAEAQNVFKQMQAVTEQTIAAGKTSPLSRTPAVAGVLDRPLVREGSPPQIAPPSQPIKVQTQAQYNTLPPGSPYIAPDGSFRTKAQ